MRARIYITIGVLFILLGSYYLYGGYELGSPKIAAVGFGSIILGAIMLLFGISRRKKKTVEPTPPSPIEDEAISAAQKGNSDSGQAEYRALVQCMGVVAVADKRIRQIEVDTIIRIISEMLGMRMTNEEVREVLSDFDDHFDIEDRLQRNRKHISPMMKRTIIQCCQKVMISDLEIAPSEQKRIMEIGLAMGLEEHEIAALTDTASK